MRLLQLAGGVAVFTLALAIPRAEVQDTSLSFFITSAGSGNGANLGGLAGADKICQSLATAAGQGTGKTWRAYLSADAAGGPMGPAIAVLPWLEVARGRVARWLEVFGRVPLFYYVLHIPLIHVLAVLISLARTPSATPWLFGNHPFRPDPVPDGYTWSLGLLYLVTAVAVVALYPACRWYARRPSRAGRSAPP